MLVAGSVTIAADGSASGSGLALARFNARKAAYEALWAANGISPPAEIRMAMARAWANELTQDSAAIVAYLVANTDVTVTGVTAGAASADGTIS